MNRMPWSRTNFDKNARASEVRSASSINAFWDFPPRPLKQIKMSFNYFNKCCCNLRWLGGRFRVLNFNLILFKQHVQIVACCQERMRDSQAAEVVINSVEFIVAVRIQHRELVVRVAPRRHQLQGSFVVLGRGHPLTRFRVNITNVTG